MLCSQDRGKRNFLYSQFSLLYTSCVTQLHGAHPVGGLGLQDVVIIKQDEGGSVIRVLGRGDNLSVLQRTDQAPAPSSNI